MKPNVTDIDDSVVLFHKRYAWLSILAILLCAAAFVLLEANRFHLKSERSEELLRISFIETLSHLDSLLASVTTKVGDLKAIAEHDLTNQKQWLW
jgi:hypothetical protein